MPVEVSVDGKRRLVVARLSGVLTLQEILGAIDGAAGDPLFGPGFDVLSDHTLVEEPITPAQAKEMVKHLRELADAFQGFRWAVVTVAPASYGMIRMVSALVEPAGIDVRVFPSLAEAEAWLGALGAAPA